MSEELPYGDLGDLVEELLPIATRLVEALRDDGLDVILDVLRTIPAETQAKVDHLPGGIHDVMHIVMAGMVSPDATLRQLLGWTETLIDPRKNRAEMPKDGGWDPPAERERQRLVAAGVPADAAIALAARKVAETQDTTRERMLRVIHGERTA